MTMQNVNNNSVVTPDISSVNEVNADNPSNIKKQNDGNIDPCVLRDSLETKRQLITLLEKGGYVKGVDFKSIKDDVNKAIADLDAIIGSLA